MGGGGVGRCINTPTTRSSKTKLLVSVTGILWFPEVDLDHRPTTLRPSPEIPVKIHTLCLPFFVFQAYSSLRSLLSFLWGQYRPCLFFLSPSLKAYQAGYQTVAVFIPKKKGKKVHTILLTPII